MTTPTEMSPCIRARLRSWFEGESGYRLLDEEGRHFARVLPQLFGYHLLQVGGHVRQSLLDESRISHRVVLELDGEGVEREQVCLRGRAGELPVLSSSIDVVLFPHVLEFEADPHQALREVDRVLIPEGHVLITGFNPWSLMGLVQAFKRRPRGVPWCGRFLPAFRVRDWLALLGFEVLATRHFFFRPPLRSRRWMQRLKFMERAGDWAWPILGGSYLIVARKRVSTLTLIRPRWRSRRKLFEDGLEPTTRGMTNTHPTD